MRDYPERSSVEEPADEFGTLITISRQWYEGAVLELKERKSAADNNVGNRWRDAKDDPPKEACHYEV